MPGAITDSARSTTARPLPTSTKRKSYASTPSRPALAYAEWNKTKINLSTRGHGDFLADARAALRVAAARGRCERGLWAAVQVQTEKTWQARGDGLPRLVVVNRLDRERASLERTLNRFMGRSAAPSFRCNCRSARRNRSAGVVDLVALKAYVFLPTAAASPANCRPGGNATEDRRGTRRAHRDGRRNDEVADGEVLEPGRSRRSSSSGDCEARRLREVSPCSKHRRC